MSERVGQQLGNYRLLRLIGQGSWASVYLGEHLHLGTQAAIKVLHTYLTSEGSEQLRSEARTMARLLHPHIVRVLDFDVVDGIPFLVMEYAPGGSLRKLHPQGTRVPLDSVVSYVKQVADALGYIHRHKLIHRDVKPENLLLGSHKEVLLTEFDLATVAQSTRSQQTQEAVGSVTYMAPEQLKGKPRPASDQYALAVVVYEWLCGALPFHGSPFEIAMQHLSLPPPPLRERMPYLSQAVEEVVLRALAKESEQRYASVQDFAAALQQASATPATAPFSPASSTSDPGEQHRSIQPLRISLL